MTDNNGRFSFKTYRPEATLVIWPWDIMNMSG